jgi:hypothetical protein
MFYFIDIESYGQTQRHIMQQMDDGIGISFPLTDENPNTATYLAWVAEGNIAEEWNPNGNQ